MDKPENKKSIAKKLYLPLFFVLTIFLGDLIGKESNTESWILKDKKNILNVFFAKWSMLWTELALICAFLATNNFSNLRETGRVILELFVGPLAYWYLVTKIAFPRLHAFANMDVSGHCFLMIHALLTNKECLGSLGRSSFVGKSRGKILRKTLVASLCLLSVIWYTMLVTTSIYFHTLWEKILGGLIGAAYWTTLDILKCKSGYSRIPNVYHLS